MTDIILGLVAIAAGAVFCFAGYLAFRLIIPIWGAFVGFSLGAALVAGFTGDGFLATGLSWIVGLIAALCFAVIAYLFYEVAVVLAMASIGFALGTSLMVALDVSWNWLVVLVGLILGALLAVAAIVFDLPLVLLLLLSALGGASAITLGLMLLTGAVDSNEFDEDAVTEQVNAGWWWYVIYIGLAIMGIVTQVRATDRLRGSMRDSWADGHTGR